MMGKTLAPALGPAGLDNWKVTIALLTGVVAKEVVVSTLGTIYAEEKGDRAGASLRAALAADPFFTPLRAYALMVFVLLYMPCAATLAVARRELNSWRWTAGMLGLSLGTAYALAAAVFWTGRLLGLR
jgi:ferrous iron transport protein B